MYWCSADAEESGQPEAMAEIAEAVTQCKFEATDRESDEVVLYKILQVSVWPEPSYPVRDLSAVLGCGGFTWGPTGGSMLWVLRPRWAAVVSCGARQGTHALAVNERTPVAGAAVMRAVPHGGASDQRRRDRHLPGLLPHRALPDGEEQGHDRYRHAPAVNPEGLPACRNAACCSPFSWSAAIAMLFPCSATSTGASVAHVAALLCADAPSVLCAAELLTQASRLVMLDVVRIIFRRLPDLPPSVPPPESAALHPLRSGAPHIPAGNLTLELDPAADGPPGAGQQPTDGQPAGLPGAEGGGEAVVGSDAKDPAGPGEQAAGAAAAADSAGLDSTAAAGVQPPVVRCFRRAVCSGSCIMLSLK